MDPINLGPEEFGPAGDTPPRQRPPREPLTPDFGQHSPALARTARLATGEYLLTVNPVDGSEVEIRPPAQRGERPRRLTVEERAGNERAGRPPVPSGPARPAPPLLRRQDEREELVRMVARGRSVRLTGPSGSGRTSLLDVVADDCSDLAPDGVVRLCGLHRTANDLLYDLFYAVHDAAGFRPEGDELLELVREIGAVVVVDDLEFGESALDELLDATPECAFLLAATPDVPAPTADSGVEEVTIGGLDRAGGLELLERAAGRLLTDEEKNWAGDLWFESEGLPLRFVQAGALLRRRDQQQAEAEAFDDAGVFDGTQSDLPVEVGLCAVEPDAPPPSLAEGAAAARLLAAGLGESARVTLRFAVALGGEVPHQAHLPALIGDTHADAALGELLDSALISPAGSRYRLAAGVRTQLASAGYADDVEGTALAAARHYAWWAGHPSVTPERVCAEADAVLAALAVLVPLTAPPGEGEESVTVRLARAAAPAFAAGGHWSAWERALRSGTEASRLSGEVADQAYFHHELGVLALCVGLLDRARAELEASIGLRGAVADKRGTVAGRRALALVDDRSGTPSALAATLGEEVADAGFEESAPPPGTALVPFPQLRLPDDDEPTTLISHRMPAGNAAAGRRGGLRGLARRNMVAAGAGALLVAVLGTVVTLGATSHENADSPSRKAGANPSATQGTGSDSLGADKAGDGDGDTGSATSRPTDPGPDGTLGTTDDPTPSATDEPTASATGTRDGTTDRPSATTSPDKSTKPKPSRSATKSATPKPSDSETSTSPEPSESETTEPTDPETTEPSTTDSAGGPVASDSSQAAGGSATESAMSGAASSASSYRGGVI